MEIEQDVKDGGGSHPIAEGAKDVSGVGVIGAFLAAVHSEYLPGNELALVTIPLLSMLAYKLLVWSFQSVKPRSAVNIRTTRALRSALNECDAVLSNPNMSDVEKVAIEKRRVEIQLQLVDSHLSDS